MLRRLRAVLITAILWGFVWAPVGAGLGFRRPEPDFFDVLPAPSSVPVMWDRVAQSALEWALLGAINGVLFAVLMALAERGRTVATVSVRRIALWGAVGTLILPGILFLALVVLIPLGDVSVNVVSLVAFLMLGASCGAGMLLMARRSRTPSSDSDVGSLTRA